MRKNNDGFCHTNFSKLQFNKTKKAREEHFHYLFSKRADTLTINTELSIKLPENSTAFLATKFEGQDIQKIIRPSKKRLWITLLNESYFNKYHKKKGRRYRLPYS